MPGQSLNVWVAGASRPRRRRQRPWLGSMAARRGGEKEYMDDDEFQNPLGQGACDGSFSLVASQLCACITALSRWAGAEARAGYAGW